ncbi:hypothetical protein MMC19_005562 [Ptychographa xylographoides]|nr:hypothetical protein [Ptychographa xylographoides]
MPNDEAEETRLSIVHQAFLVLLSDQLTVARLPDSIERILDVGTGSGDWATLIAERYPDAEIVATDISAYQQPPTVPANVFFQIDDAREEWTFSTPFNLIHIRGLCGAFTDWSHIYSEAYKHLKPGGILEVVDLGPIQAAEQSTTSYLSTYNGALQSAADKAGTTIGLEHLRKSLVEASGLNVLKTTSLEISLGTQSRDSRMKMVGKMALVAAMEGLEATALRLLTQKLDWDPNDVRDLCKKVVNEVLQSDARPSIPCRIMVARKLLDLV